MTRTFMRSSFMERASNGTLNVAISYSRQPSAHTSEAKAYGLRSARAAHGRVRSTLQSPPAQAA